MQHKRMRLSVLTSMLQVRPEEQRHFLLLAAVLFTILLVDGIMDVFSVAGFVSNVGIYQVPYLALTQGVALLLFSNGYTLLVDRWPKPRLLPVLLVIYGLLLCGARGLIAWGQAPFTIYALLYVLRWQMFFLLGIVFWAIVSDTFTLATANRLVPVIGAAGFLGTTLGNKLGGESGRLLVRYGLQPADVLWIVAALLGFGAWVLWRLNRRGGGLLEMGAPSKTGAHRQSLRETLWQAPRFVREARIFRLLTIIIFISSIGFFLILFTFLSLGKAAYTDDLDFQAFYGNVQAGLQVVIFLLQLFVANRLFVRRGAVSALLGLPFVLLGGGMLFALVPGLWTGILVMYANDIHFLVFERPSIDVLFTLVPPQITGRVKTLLDIFVRPAGYIVSGGLLLLMIQLAQGGWLHVQRLEAALGLLLLPLSLISLVAVVLLVRNYATYLHDWQLARRKRHIPDFID